MPTLQAEKDNDLQQIQGLQQRFALIQTRPELPSKSRSNLYEQYHLTLAELEKCLQSKIIFMEAHKVELVEMTRLDPDETTQNVVSPIEYLENGVIFIERPVFKYPKVTINMYELSKAFKKQLTRLDKIVSRLELTCFDIECETQMSLSPSSSTSSPSFMSSFRGHFFGFDNSDRSFEERILYRDPTTLIYYGNEGTTRGLNGVVQKNGHWIVCGNLAYAAAKSRMSNFLSHMSSEASMMSSELIDPVTDEQQQSEQHASHYYFAPAEGFGDALYTLSCLLIPTQDIIGLLHSYNHAMAFSLSFTTNQQLRMTFFDPNENTTKQIIFLNNEAIKQFTFDKLLTEDQIKSYQLDSRPFSVVIQEKLSDLPEVIDKVVDEKHKIQLYLMYNRHELLHELLTSKISQMVRQDFLYEDDGFSHSYIAMLSRNQASDHLISYILNLPISEQDKIDILIAKHKTGEPFLFLMMLTDDVKAIDYYMNKVLLSNLSDDSKFTLLNVSGEMDMTPLAGAIWYAAPHAVNAYLSYLPQFQLSPKQIYEILLKTVKSLCVASINVFPIKGIVLDVYQDKLADSSEIVKAKTCISLITDYLLSFVSQENLNTFIDVLFEFENSLLFSLYIRPEIIRLIEISQEPYKTNYESRLSLISANLTRQPPLPPDSNPFSFFSDSDGPYEDPVITAWSDDDNPFEANLSSGHEWPPEPKTDDDESSLSPR